MMGLSWGLILGLEFLSILGLYCFRTEFVIQIIDHDVLSQAKNLDPQQVIEYMNKVTDGNNNTMQ